MAKRRTTAKKRKPATKKKPTKKRKPAAKKKPVRGFAANARRIAKEKGISLERARAILAAGTRRASPAAKRRNPRLKRVKGKAKAKGKR